MTSKISGKMQNYFMPAPTVLADLGKIIVVGELHAAIKEKTCSQPGAQR